MENLCSSGASYLQDGAPSWCKIGAHLVPFLFRIVLLAGAKCAHVMPFISPQNGAHRDMLMLPQQRSREEK